MEPTFWAPLAVSFLIALVAAAVTINGTRAQKAATKEDKTQREADLVVAGLSALLKETTSFLNEVQEERTHERQEHKACREELTRTQEALARCLAGE